MTPHSLSDATVPPDSAGRDPSFLEVQRQRLMGALAGGIAHDLNNLLAGVVSNLELALADEQLAAETAERVRKAYSCARRIAEFNNRTLAFSRRVERRMTPVDWTGVVEEVTCLLGPSLGHGKRVVFAPLPPDLWRTHADRGQITQALIELCLYVGSSVSRAGDLFIRLENASQAERPGGSAGRAGAFVRLTLEAAPANTTIPSRQQPADSRLVSTTDVPADLGLRVAQEIMEQYSGWLEVQDDARQGRRVCAFLPRAEANAHANDTPQAGSPADVTPGTILLADPDEPMRLFMRAVLAYQGHRILDAADSDEAFRQLERVPAQVDLVLLNPEMPRLEDARLLAAIQRGHPSTRLVVLGTEGLEAPHRAALRTAAAAVLRRPIGREGLVQVVRQALAEGRSAR